MTKVVIIGGVAGGATAAARLRRLREDLEIIILEKGSHISFANCGLPYYVGNTIKDEEQLELMTPEEFFDRFNVEVRVNHEALSINKEDKVILVKNHLINKTYQLDYDFLILSPGASPIIPPFAGINEVPVFTLRTIPDSINIRNYIERNGVKHTTIIGGGFIGLEMAENLRNKGIKVKIIEMLDQVMAPLDREIAQFIHQELILNQVCVHLDDPVESFQYNEDGIQVKTKKGDLTKTDLIILSIGVKPESQLAIDAGLEIGPRDHIIVDDHMRTSDPSIYAVGDAVQVKHLITG
ncbi:MAG: NAD(P)/FAD-dependent oxidoreductase [Promethearchaeota archaeon]